MHMLIHRILALRCFCCSMISLACTSPKKPAAAKKPAEKKAPAKAAKKEAEQEMILQFGGREIKEKDLYERIQQIWIEGYGKKAEELKSLKVYVKPEEFTAYYVINDDVTGSIDL